MESEQKKKTLLDFWSSQLNLQENELTAFGEVDRADFIAEELKELAYEDTPLPLLRGKTISQPTTVVIMTTALELKTGNKVFEVGTGSGYQAAIIAKIVGKKGKVITTEVIPELVHFSRQNFKKAGIVNVTVYEEDGSKGMANKAPFDKIIITAAAKEFPKELLEQLKPGGIIVAPIGNEKEQSLVKGRKEEGRMELEFLGQFTFTPMYGKYGFVT